MFRELCLGSNVEKVFGAASTDSLIFPRKHPMLRLHFDSRSIHRAWDNRYGAVGDVFFAASCD